MLESRIIEARVHFNKENKAHSGSAGQAHEGRNDARQPPHTMWKAVVTKYLLTTGHVKRWTFESFSDLSRAAMPALDHNKMFYSDTTIKVEIFYYTLNFYASSWEWFYLDNSAYSGLYLPYIDIGLAFTIYIAADTGVATN